MKHFYTLLIAAGLLSAAAISYPTETKKHTKHVTHKKHEEKHEKKHSTTKSHTKENEHPKKHTPAKKAEPAVAHKNAAPATAPATKTGEPTAYQKVGEWLGLSTAGAAGATVATAGHRAAGYHIGPRDWHHNFPDWWKDRGWTAADVDGVWYFAGYPIEWWASKPEYASYYKDVIRHEYLKAHPEKR